MSDIAYTLCDKCKARVQSEFIHFHNCEDEKKIKEVEALIQAALDENSKLKIQNSELKKSIESIRKEVGSSFSQMNEIVKGYVKKLEDSKKPKEETTEKVEEVK